MQLVFILSVFRYCDIFPSVAVKVTEHCFVFFLSDFVVSPSCSSQNEVVRVLLLVLRFNE